MKRFRHFLRVLRAQIRVAWMTALQYRSSFLGEFVTAGLWVGFTVAPLFVVYRHREGLAGWTYQESLLVVGFFITLQGLMEAFIDPNLRSVVQHVRKGTLDFILLKPMDAQLQVSIHQSAPAKFPHVLAGLLLIVATAVRLPRAPSPGAWLLAGLILAASVVLLHAIYTLIVCLSFWFVRVDNLSHLLLGFLDTSRWPVNMYRGAIRFFLTFILPLGVMTTYPALALRGLLQPSGAATVAAVALGFLWLSRRVWLLAVARYASASS
ncbi:MAG: ABC transporter permease [Planctomycetota bacterium]|nr:MAG: ABC transporter permease [Planctomycetota bacterium]